MKRNLDDELTDLLGEEYSEKIKEDSVLIDNYEQKKKKENKPFSDEIDLISMLDKKVIHDFDDSDNYNDKITTTISINSGEAPLSESDLLDLEDLDDKQKTNDTKVYDAIIIVGLIVFFVGIILLIMNLF